MPRATFGALRALSPDVQTGLQAALSNVEALHAQVLFDLRTLTDQGRDVSAFAAEAEGVSAAIGGVQADLLTSNDTDESALQARIATIDEQARALLARTGAARQGVVEGQQFTGLWWGLGVVAIGAGVALFVWDQRKRRRR